jgi:hypothetical protein
MQISVSTSISVGFFASFTGTLLDNRLIFKLIFKPSVETFLIRQCVYRSIALIYSRGLRIQKASESDILPMMTTTRLDPWFSLKKWVRFLPHHLIPHPFPNPGPHPVPNPVPHPISYSFPHPISLSIPHSIPHPISHSIPHSIPHLLLTYPSPFPLLYPLLYPSPYSSPDLSLYPSPQSAPCPPLYPSPYLSFDLYFLSSSYLVPVIPFFSPSLFFRPFFFFIFRLVFFSS